MTYFKILFAFIKLSPGKLNIEKCRTMKARYMYIDIIAQK